MRTIPPPQAQESTKSVGWTRHKHRKGITDAEENARAKILERCPVKTLKDFTKEELVAMAKQYRPHPPKVYDFDTILTSGPYENRTIEEVVEMSPQWILWAIDAFRGFYVREAVVVACQKRMEALRGKTYTK